MQKAIEVTGSVIGSIKSYKCKPLMSWKMAAIDVLVIAIIVAAH